MLRLDERGSIGALLIVIIMVALVAIFAPTAFDSAVSKTRQYVYGVIDRNRYDDTTSREKVNDGRYWVDSEDRSVQKQDSRPVQAVQKEQVPVEVGQYRAVVRGAVVPVGSGYRLYVTMGVDDRRGRISAVIGIIDTGSPVTYVAARRLESAGYTPVSDVFYIEGRGPYRWFEVPSLYVNTGNGKWVQVAGRVRVIGEDGKDKIFSDTEILVGMDVLSKHNLYVTGNEWVLGVK